MTQSRLNETGGGNLPYLTPEIMTLDIAVEKGFVNTGQLNDYEADPWSN